MTVVGRFKFQNASQLFIGVHHELLFVVAMLVSNPDLAP